MLSDAIPPSLSKTEFIQVRLSHFFKKNATALNVHRLNHTPKEKDELIVALENKPRERWSVCGWGLGGQSHSFSPEWIMCYVQKFGLRLRKKSDRYVVITVSQIKCQQISLLPSF